jgi:signal transduction histidine kinase
MIRILIPMHFNSYTILPILCMLLSMLCGTFVIAQNPKAKLNRLFLAICITFIGWFSFYIPYNFNYTDELVLTWIKISYCFISFVPITTFTFITTYLQIPKNELWFKTNSAIGLIFAISSITTNWLISGLIHYSWYPYPKAGFLHPFFILHCVILVSLSIKLAFDALRNPNLSSKQRNHIKYMIIAMLVGSISMFDFLGNYNIPVIEIAFIPISGYLIITTIAIIRHQLMDIHIVIRKSLIYSLLVTMITFIFLISVLISQHLLNQTFHNQDIIISFITAMLIALVFTPLKNKIQEFVDYSFLKATPIEVAEQNEMLRQEIIKTEKFKAVAALASSIVHEIRNPLTAINTFSEHIPQKKNDPEFLEQFSKIVPSEINRINGLMQELLAFSKPSEPKLESIDPNLLIQNVINLLSPHMAKANVKTRIQLTNSPIKIQADPSQLKQALMNILMNASEAMPNGGELKITTQKLETKDSLYIIEISDTGHGINSKDIPHIFEPFFTKKEKGTGLGLAITQGIIEKHGGIINVESKINQGTTFKIKLKAN